MAKFEDAITRAVTSCKQSGNEPTHHFADTGKMIGNGNGAIQNGWLPIGKSEEE
jgi:DNA-damage-inducible protein D